MNSTSIKIDHRPKSGNWRLHGELNLFAYRRLGLVVLSTLHDVSATEQQYCCIYIFTITGQSRLSSEEQLQIPVRSTRIMCYYSETSALHCSCLYCRLSCALCQRNVGRPTRQELNELQTISPFPLSMLPCDDLTPMTAGVERWEKEDTKIQNSAAAVNHTT